MHERIRELRKNYLHMSQTEFGKRLGVSRSVVKNIELDALARPDQKLSLIKLMCKEFSVSEEWLLNGTGPMLLQDNTSISRRMASEYRLSERECAVVSAFLELEPQDRAAVMRYIDSIVDKLSSPTTFTQSEDSVEALEEEYKKTVLGKPSEPGTSVLNSTDGTRKKKAVGDE